MIRKVPALGCFLAALALAPFGFIAVVASAQTSDVASPTDEPGSGTPAGTTFVGPKQILFADADTVFVLRSKEWWSGNVRDQEKLLLHSLRMRYWLSHLPSDMRVVFDRLGYPSGRLMLTPVGHTEEWWYYGQLSQPLRFRDGQLLDWDRLEQQESRR